MYALGEVIGYYAFIMRNLNAVLLMCYTKILLTFDNLEQLLIFVHSISKSVATNIIYNASFHKNLHTESIS